MKEQTFYVQPNIPNSKPVPVKLFSGNQSVDEQTITAISNMNFDKASHYCELKGWKLLRIDNI